MEGSDWEELLQYIAAQRVVPIIGRDALVADGPQNELVDVALGRSLAQQLGIDFDATTSGWPLHRVAFEYLRRGGSPNRIYSKTCLIEKEARSQPVPDAIRRLAEITDFRLLVATTVDGYLARAVAEVRRRAPTVLSYRPKECADLPASRPGSGEDIVYQLFGEVSPCRDDYAVTEEDTLEFLHALQSDVRRPQHFFDTLRQSHLLLIGCSFPDWLARFFLRTVRAERLLNRTPTVQFLVDDQVRRDPSLTSFLEQHGVQVWKHSDCTTFVRELHERWKLNARQREDARELNPNAMPEGAVFLSYAREDAGCAMRLRDALDASDFTVWLDTRDIPPGSIWDHEIRKNISHCSVFLPIISLNTERRREGYFRREWNIAAERDSYFDDRTRFVWPVLIDPELEKPVGVPEAFQRHQYTRLPEGRPTEVFMAELRREIRERQRAHAR
jgi:hypothetical protein